jgi:hypothetical protein
MRAKGSGPRYLPIRRPQRTQSRFDANTSVVSRNFPMNSSTPLRPLMIGYFLKNNHNPCGLVSSPISDSFLGPVRTRCRGKENQNPLQTRR